MTYGTYQEKEKKQRQKIKELMKHIDWLLKSLNSSKNEISRIESEQECIDEIIKMREDYTFNYTLLFKCIHFLEYLGVISEYEKIKGNCINAIIKISKNSESNIKFFYRTLFVCIHAIQHIYKISQSEENAKKIIDGIIEILTNETINQYMWYECINTLQCIYEKYEYKDIGKRCNNIIKYMLLNNEINNKKIKIEYIEDYKNIDQYIINMYYHTLDDILIDSKNLKIEEIYIDGIIKILEKSDKEGILDGCIQVLEKICINFEDYSTKNRCIDGIIKILEKSNKEGILYGCIRVLEKICINFEDYNTKNRCIDGIMWILKNKKNIQNIQRYCIGIFKNIYEKYKASEDLEYQKIKEKCVNGIKEVLEKYIEKLNNETSNNKNDNLYILFECEYCIKVLECIAAYSKMKDTQKCIKAIIEISENKNIDEYNLSSCIYLLGKIYKYSNQEIKKLCSNGIIEISEKKKINEDKLYSLCTNGINEILQNKTQESDYDESKQISPKTNTEIIVSDGNDQSNNNENQPVVQNDNKSHDNFSNEQSENKTQESDCGNSEKDSSEYLDSNNQSNNNENQSVAQSSNHVDNQSKKGKGNTENGGMQFGK